MTFKMTKQRFLIENCLQLEFYTKPVYKLSLRERQRYFHTFQVLRNLQSLHDSLESFLRISSTKPKKRNTWVPTQEVGKVSPVMMAQRVPIGNNAVGAASPGWSSSGVIRRNLFNKIKCIEHLIMSENTERGFKYNSRKVLGLITDDYTGN